jgi:hypothetical protein
LNLFSIGKLVYEFANEKFEIKKPEKKHYSE